MAPIRGLLLARIAGLNKLPNVLAHSWPKDLSGHAHIRRWVMEFFQLSREQGFLTGTVDFPPYHDL